jgi:hypothetical protein
MQMEVAPCVRDCCWLFRFEEQNPAVWCDRASCRFVSKQ